MKTEITGSNRQKHKNLNGFVLGVVCTQFVNSALHIAQPLLMAELTQSLGQAAFFSSFDTAVHTFGTYMGGWPTDRFGARRVLILATLSRGFALAAIPLMMFAGILSPLWAAFWYTLDAFVRGFVDSAVYTLPLELCEHDATELDRLNSRYELAFDIGGIVGPLALGGMMAWLPGPTAHVFIPIGFAVSASAYSSMAQSETIENKRLKQPQGGSWAGIREIFANRALLFTCFVYMFFNLYPLRKLLSAFFAKAILGNPAAAGILGSAFGMGGLLGTLIYSSKGDLGSSSRWIFAGAAGILALACGWIPASLVFMCLAAFFFSLTNSGARLTLIRIRQELTPLHLAGGVTSASRFGANLISVGGKALVGWAFLSGTSPVMAFSLVSALLVAIAIVHLSIARRFDVSPSPLATS